MKTNKPAITQQLAAFKAERNQLADILQNDLNQILASVLLSIQFNKSSVPDKEDKLIFQAESQLKMAIEKISTLHYSLTQNSLVQNIN